MKVKIELTKNDLDLMALKENPDYNLEEAMLNAIAEYVADGRCERRMVVPGIVEDTEWLNIFEDGLYAELDIDDFEYDDVLRWMASLHPEYLAQAVKNIFRSSIINPPGFVYERSFTIVDAVPLANAVEEYLAREKEQEEKNEKKD